MLTAFLIGFAAGFANTAHCLGMCGGFPLHLSKGSDRRQSAVRGSLFILGKSFTYIFLGALAGAAGVILLKNTRLAAAGPFLRIGAGALTIIFGLLMLGLRAPSIRPFREITDAGTLRSLLSPLLINPGPGAAFALGLGVGFLPCPLPLAMLAASAGYHSVLLGMATMAGVGLGTAPGLLAAALLGVGISHRFARSGMRVAGLAVIAIGLLTIGRATGMIDSSHKQMHAAPSCCGGDLH